MRQTAFTMLELVFVIVVVGILSVALIPRFERDQAAEAAFQIERHIRLAQHHAMVDDRYDGSSDWEKEMWQIAFTHSTANNGDCYDVFSDRNRLGNVSTNEAAIDPLTKKPLFSNNCDESGDYNGDVLLWKQYGVNSVSLSSACGSNKYIAFDHLGRPYSQIGARLSADCVITLSTNDGHSADITVFQETGFAKVTKIDSTNL